MSSVPIYFQFHDLHSTTLAYDTLRELGYHAHLLDHEQKMVVQMYVDHNDLTSALEIAQAHGGSLQETADTLSDSGTFGMAYNMDQIPIPAHVVNEDWTDDEYAESARDTVLAGQDKAEEFDPSDGGYDHFPAGIRL